MKRSDRPIDGRYLTVFFIYKGRSQGLVISTRDANNREMRNYDKTQEVSQTKVRDPLPEHFNYYRRGRRVWDMHSTADYFLRLS